MTTKTTDKHIQYLTDEAGFRASDVAKGLETSRFAALMVMKKAEGIAEALKIEDGDNERAGAIVKHADQLVAQIDPEYRKHREKRYSSNKVDIDFGQPR